MPSTKAIAFRIAFSFVAGAYFVFTGLQCRHDYPYIEQPRSITRQSTYKNNMKQIGLALYNYHDEHGSFPPTYLTDKNGRRLHSWRTLLLPFLEQMPLFEKIDLSKPWNEQPKLEYPPLALLQCPSANVDEGRTTYLAVIGTETAWRKNGAIGLADFKDDPASTILLIETDHDGRHWAAPKDIALEDLSLTVNDRTRPSLSSGHSVRATWFWQPRIPVVHVVFADGNTMSIRADIPPDVLKAMLTIDGGESVDREELIKRRPPLNPGFCLSIGLLFVVHVWLKVVARGYAVSCGALLGAGMAVLCRDPCLIGIPVTLLWTLTGWRISQTYRNLAPVEDEANAIHNPAG